SSPKKKGHPSGGPFWCCRVATRSEAEFGTQRQQVDVHFQPVAVRLQAVVVQAQAEALTEVVTGIDAEVRLGGAGLGFLDVAVDIERGNAARDADATADEEALMGAAEVLLADHAHARAVQTQRVVVEAVVERGLVGMGVETLDRE